MMGTGVKQKEMESTCWLLDAALGREGWWEQLEAAGAPLCEPLSLGGPVGSAGDQVRVSFLWRDPEGSELESTYVRVYIDVNSVTDHHSFEPQSLQRVPGTDVWYWQVDLPANWRGSYCYIPVRQEQLPPHILQENEANPKQQQQAQRAWWQSISGRAMADPLNPCVHRNAWGAYSALHLPAAPDQSAWLGEDSTRAEPGHDPARSAQQEWQWHSALLSTSRTVWLYQTGTGSSLPLVILLDGRRWAQEMPIYNALDKETERSRLPAARYLFVDSVSGAQRSRELACDDVFWNAVVQELLPGVALAHKFILKPETTVVAGQSLGGLAAMHAALNYPHVFGAVVSQSGSFWWPYVELLHAAPGQPCLRKPGAQGLLAEKLDNGIISSPVPLHIFMEVGSREDVMIDVNESMRNALVAAGHQVHFQQFEGGHDGICWRGGLLEGLAVVLPEQAESRNS